MLFVVTALLYLFSLVATQTPRPITTVAAEVYDFIVVGGGTAGCAVASRLSENGRHRVLLLHNSGLPPPQADIPALTAPLYADPNTTITVGTAPQANAARRNNGVVNFLVGRPIGGTSAMNAMFMNRGSPHDYNQWAEITNDESWNYDNMLKYFNKFEDYQGRFNTYTGQHGFHGPIPTGRQYYEPGQAEWLQAGRELGYPIADPNGPQINSFQPIEHNRRGGRRVSSYQGYIEPFLGSRPNLKVLLNSPVDRVVLDKRRVIGVVFQETISLPGLIPDSALREVFVRARKEVILTGGVIGSPEVLFRSGIGPRDVLQLVGVRPVKILPVGENLQDHPLVTLQVSFNRSDMVLDPVRELTPQSWKYFLKYGDGPYSCFQGATGQAFFASSVAAREGVPYWADSEIQILNTGDMHIRGAGAGPAVPPPPGVFPAFSVILMGRPKSRGRLSVNATDMNPLVDFRYYAHPDDMQVMIEAIETYIRAIEETSLYQRAGAAYTRLPMPECDKFAFRSFEYWECYVRQTSQSGWHAVGSCSMGRGPQDPSAVVDTNGRVIGIKALRVADASIMPTITNGNTMAPVYAIAEKLSDVILQHWERNSRREYLH